MRDVYSEQGGWWGEGRHGRFRKNWHQTDVLPDGKGPRGAGCRNKAGRRHSPGRERPGARLEWQEPHKGYRPSGLSFIPESRGLFFSFNKRGTESDLHFGNLAPLFSGEQDSKSKSY